MNEKSVQACSYVTRTQSLVGPGKLPRGRFDIHQVPVEDNVLYQLSSLIPYYGSPFLLFDGERDVEITCNNNIFWAVLAKSRLKGVPAAAFISK